MSERELVKCHNHPERPAVARCVVGAEPLCGECVREADGRYYCAEHVPAAEPRARAAPAGRWRPAYLLAAAAVVAALWGVLFLLRPAAKEGAAFYREETAGARLAEVAAAAENFKKDMGRYPTPAEGLGVLVKQPPAGGERWLGPYLPASAVKGGAVVDANGKALGYRVGPDGKPVVTAPGADGVLGTADDKAVTLDGKKPGGLPTKFPGFRDFVGLPPSEK